MRQREYRTVRVPEPGSRRFEHPAQARANAQAAAYTWTHSKEVSARASGGLSCWRMHHPGEAHECAHNEFRLRLSLRCAEHYAFGPSIKFAHRGESRTEGRVRRRAHVAPPHHHYIALKTEFRLVLTAPTQTRGRRLMCSCKTHWWLGSADVSAADG